MRELSAGLALSLAANTDRTLRSMVRLMWRVVSRKGGFMYRVLVWVVVVCATAGCSYVRPSSDPSAPNRCYVESGWLDSSNGCSVRAGYPDCYLVCPDKGRESVCRDRRSGGLRQTGVRAKDRDTPSTGPVPTPMRPDWRRMVCVIDRGSCPLTSS